MRQNENIPEWNSKYSIGIKEIDLQHHFFLKLVKRFFDYITEKTSEELVNSHIDEVVNYLDFHFISEENLMKIYKYPEYETHKSSHIALKATLADQITLYRIKEANLDDITSFLIQLFYNHTITEDKLLGDYVTCTNK